MHITFPAPTAPVSLLRRSLAALQEGVTLIRREPKAAAAWVGMWTAYFFIASLMLVISRQAGGSWRGERGSAVSLVERYGIFGLPLTIVFFVLFGVTTAAIYRAVLRPGDRRNAYLRFGADEVRLGVLQAGLLLFEAVFGGVPTYLLTVVIEPFMRVLPWAGGALALVGFLATVAVNTWLGVRLSLINVETFAERRFHVTAYWPVTRGNFWYLLLTYFLYFLLLFVTFLVFAGVLALVTALSHAPLPGHGLLRSTSLLGLAAILTILTSGFWMFAWIIFCASQAHAFRAILAEGHSADVHIE